jgi:hypothetical protein
VLRVAGVVEVVVGDQHGVDVGGRVPEPRQRRAEITPVSRQSRVEQGEAASLLEQVPVRVDALQAMDARRNVG